MNDFEPFKTPMLGRFIARIMTTLGLVDPNRPEKFDYLRVLKTFAIFIAFIWVPIIFMAAYGVFSIFGAFYVETDNEQLRWLALAFTALLAALAGLIGAPLALIRVFVTERQTKAAEEGLITDRITKAVEQLGAEKTVKRIVDGQPQEWTEPNVEVRLGGIYALERIAQDSERDHIPVMETLCAYIRQNTSEGAAKEFNLMEWLDEGREIDVKLKHGERLAARRRWLEQLGPVRPPRDDVRAALTVLERRKAIRKVNEKAAKPPFRIDITRTNLQRADLSQIDISGANAHLARLEGANLWAAKMDGANLSGANLRSANLALWSGLRANCRAADFGDAKNMKQEQVNAIFGDKKTTLPNYVDPPDHWADEPLDNPWDDDPAYKDWIARGAPPGKPNGS